MTLRWIPGQGPDNTAIERLKQKFPKPEKLPPHAWFMTGVEHFGDMSDVAQSLEPDDFKYLQYFLDDVGGGIKAFEMRLEEWVDWFHYLLPYIVIRADVNALTGSLANYLINLYPDAMPEIYPEFREDVLKTLGYCLMAPKFWQDYDLSDELLSNEFEGRLHYNQQWFMYTLSPMIVVCLKYLRPPEIVEWVDSLAKIPGKHWNYHFLTWIHCAIILLESYVPSAKPADMTISFLNHLNLSWSNIYRLGDLRVPRANLQAFVDELIRHRFLHPAEIPR